MDAYFFGNIFLCKGFALTKITQQISVNRD